MAKKTKATEKTVVEKIRDAVKAPESAEVSLIRDLVAIVKAVAPAGTTYSAVLRAEKYLENK